MIILKAENISKQYRLGNVGTGTLSHDLNRFWHRIRGKEDPYLKVGAVNDRSNKAKSDYVWALRDINFEVQEGEVLGIIGKNGAGKSTLLKILSRVTSPTTGVIKTKGRIASLLEVGTGFHPELTGRENIYLNGAILGMTRGEITAKLEEIIDFSGCEMYIDTPVKRYSSGMTVRLAFAVAAHLEPDILVVDEVLAVGDAEFQKKAIGKMQDISKGEGRTVLFVSHNMAAVKSLCSRGIVLEKGQLTALGSIDKILSIYTKQKDKDIVVKETCRNFKFIDCEISSIDSSVNIESNLCISFHFDVVVPMNEPLFLDVAIKNVLGEIILHLKMDYTKFYLNFSKKGNVFFNLVIEKPNLLPDEYHIDIYLYNNLNQNLMWLQGISPFIVNGFNKFLNRETFNSIQAKTLPKYYYTLKRNQF